MWLNYDLHWNPVRLIQRFGRVDRIGSPYDQIHLHNMLPDMELDETLGLTDRLGDRIQAMHDIIGLDNKVLSESEKLNPTGIGKIYDDRTLPELDDEFDELTANQRAISLLQRIRNTEPDLWKTITELPDGIRSALATHDTAPAGVDQPKAGESIAMMADDGHHPLLRCGRRSGTAGRSGRPSSSTRRNAFLGHHHSPRRETPTGGSTPPRSCSSRT